MKKLIISILGIAIVLVVFYVVMKPAVIAPNGELMSPTPTSTASADVNINITSPKSGAAVSSPFIVTGVGRVFEQQLNWRLVDANGNKVLEGTAMTNAPDVGLFGPYSFTVATSAKGNMEVWVFDYSAKDGSIIDLVKIPVIVQ